MPSTSGMGIFRITVGAKGDAKDVPLSKLAVLYSAISTLDEKYNNFVVLPRDVVIGGPDSAKAARQRVLSGEFNAFMKKPTIHYKKWSNCKTRTNKKDCTTNEKYADITIVMIQINGPTRVRTVDANKAVKKFKPLFEASEKPKSKTQPAS